MNREIKFRVWNDYDKKLINWSKLLEQNLPNIFTIPMYLKKESEVKDNVKEN